MMLRRALVALWPLLAGCGPELSYAYMSKDSSGSLKTTKFHTRDEIHCLMELLAGDEDTVLNLYLTGPEGPEISEAEYYPRPDPREQGPVKIDLQLEGVDPITGERTTEGPWPLGGYKIDIHLDGDLAESLDFEVIPP